MVPPVPCPRCPGFDPALAQTRRAGGRNLDAALAQAGAWDVYFTSAPRRSATGWLALRLVRRARPATRHAGLARCRQHDLSLDSLLGALARKMAKHCQLLAHRHVAEPGSTLDYPVCRCSRPRTGTA